MTLKFAAPDSPYVFESTQGVDANDIFGKATPLDPHTLKEAVPLPNSAEPGYSAIYRNKTFPEALKWAISPQLTTIYELLINSFKYYSNKPAFAWREYDYETGKSAPDYTSITYLELNKTRSALGAGLMYLLKSNPYKDSARYASHAKIDNHERDYKSYDSNNMSFVATLFSGNRAEWCIADVMTSTLSITNTALYDTLGPSTSQFILSSTESPVVITSSDHIESLVKLKADNPLSLGQFIAIISMDPLDLKGSSAKALKDQGLVAYANENNITVHDWNQVRQLGEIFPIDDLPPTTESVYTISFTSGTTGANPKGVILTHKIATSGITFVLSQFPQEPNSKAFLFLPLAHIYERQNYGVVLTAGCCAGFPRLHGTPLTLVEDLKIFKPSHMSNVPRVYSKFEAALRAATVDHPTSALKRSLFQKVIDTKIEKRRQREVGGDYHLLYDPTVIKKLRALLGYDNMVWTVTGSAPISPATIEFLQAALNVSLFQGYGLTESYAGISGSVSNDSLGSCGAIGITGEIRVRELPEMGYHLDGPNGPSGELMLRGPQIFQSYFKNPEETAKAVSKDGWFSTGDVARISKEGRIYIVDRVKNFFKLAQGEYVTPEKVENTYLSGNHLLTQAYVHGDSHRHFLVAVLGVDPQGIVSFLVEKCGHSKASLRNKSPQEILEILNKREVRKELLTILNTGAYKKKALQGFERLHNIYVEFEPLTVERGVVTPTVKLKRPIALKFFKTQIEAMYDEGLLLYDQSKM